MSVSDELATIGTSMALGSAGSLLLLSPGADYEGLAAVGVMVWLIFPFLLAGVGWVGMLLEYGRSKGSAEHGR